MSKEKEKVINAITGFIKGGDNSDLTLLDSVMHKDFRVTNNGFMGKPGITIIDKQAYLENIRKGIFGSLPRTMNIISIDIHVSIAIVKLEVESSENNFVSYNSMVLDIDDNWKIINNLAIVDPKKNC